MMAVGMSRPTLRMVMLILNSEIYMVGEVCAVSSARVSTVPGCDSE
jgi:hypothetical protein